MYNSETISSARQPSAIDIHTAATTTWMLIFLALSVASCSHSATRSEYRATIAQAKADYKASMRRCQSLRGNDEDVCEKQAKAEYTKAETDAKSTYKGTAHAQADAMEDQAEANYKVARERCDPLSGDEKDACIKRAKIEHGQ
jgi:hypothetical protein